MTAERIKRTRAHYPGWLLMIRAGDHYRFNGGDALKVSRDCQMAVHTIVREPVFVSFGVLDAPKYLAMLLKAGHKVVVLEEGGEEICHKPAPQPTQEAQKPGRVAQEELFR